MQYRIRWFDATAATVREEVAEAETADAAGLRVAGANGVVLSVGAERRPRTARGSGLDVAWWCRELRTLVSAGMTVVEALETLQAQRLGDSRAALHADLVRLLRQGQSLSTAMASTGAFPGILIAGVKGSERTSSLVEALDEYLRYQEMLDRLRKQVVSAAIYPMVVVTLGVCIALFLLLFVIPRFSRMYADLHGPVSAATQALLFLSRALAEHNVAIVAALLAAGAGAIAAWRSGAVARGMTAAVVRMPWLAARIRDFQLAKLYHSLALMFRGGYALDEALRHCAALGLDASMSVRVQQARDALAVGRRVSSALTEAGLTDEVSQRLLTVGERTGSFDKVLSTIAERHASEFTLFVERATRLVEPLLLLFVALLIGGIVVAMYMPIFDIAGGLG